jgi:hypothetical protein
MLFPYYVSSAKLTMKFPKTTFAQATNALAESTPDAQYANFQLKSFMFGVRAVVMEAIIIIYLNGLK